MAEVAQHLVVAAEVTRLAVLLYLVGAVVAHTELQLLGVAVLQSTLVAGAVLVGTPTHLQAARLLFCSTHKGQT